MKQNYYSLRIVALTVMMSICTLSVFAQTVKKHVVQRGETLVSIAQKYSVSKDDIIKANPDAAQFVYVGMELTIPAKQGDNVIVTRTVEQPSYEETPSSATKSEVVQSSRIVSEDDYEKWTGCLEISYGFLKTEKGAKGTSLAYRFTAGANYHIMKDFYVGARIGYNSATYNSYVRPASQESEFHLLCIPIETGYSFYFNDSRTLGVIPFAGLDFNIGLSGKAKTKVSGYGEQKEKIKIGGKVGVGARIGVTLNLWGFSLTGSYVLPVNDNQKRYFGKDAYPEVGIGWRM